MKLATQPLRNSSNDDEIAVDDRSASREAMPAPVASASVADLGMILWHGRRWIGLLTVVLVLATLAYGVLTAPLYNASAEIFIDPREKQVLTKDVNPSTVSPDGGIAQIDSQVRIIQSASVLNRAIAALKLTDDSEFNGKSFLSDLLGFGAAGSSAEARTLATLKKRLAVKRADKVLVVELIATAQTPEKSARIANAIADAYLADQAAAKEFSGTEASGALSARLAEQKQRVQDAENKVQAYKANKNMISASGQLVSEQQLTDLNKDLESAKMRTGTLRAQMEQIRRLQRNGSSTDATAEAIQSATIVKLREQESTLVQRAADLQSQLGPRHPAIAAVQLQMAQVRKVIVAELGRISKSAQADLDRASANERSLSASLERLKTENLTTSQDNVRLHELERDLEASRAVYSQFLLRANETRDQAGIDSTNARIITRAVPPVEKSWPLMGILLAGALGSGLGLGATGVLAREYARPVVLTTGQAERALGVPAAGALPCGKAIDAGNSASFDGAARMALNKLFPQDIADNTPGRLNSVLFVHGDADKAVCGPLALKIAGAAVRAGERVLFIDAASQPEAEALRPGLMDMLRADCVLRQAMRYENETGLYRVDAGRALQMLPEREARYCARQMLADAQRKFDLVVIHAGDLRQRTELAPLLAVVDEVVVVAVPGQSQQGDLASLSETAGIMGQTASAVLMADPARAA